MSCPVCFENRWMVTTICGHILCDNCIQKISHCPICRHCLTSKYKITYKGVYTYDYGQTHFQLLFKT